MPPAEYVETYARKAANDVLNNVRPAVFATPRAVPARPFTDLFARLAPDGRVTPSPLTGGVRATVRCGANRRWSSSCRHRGHDRGWQDRGRRLRRPPPDRRGPSLRRLRRPAYDDNRGPGLRTAQTISRRRLDHARRQGPGPWPRQAEARVQEYGRAWGRRSRGSGLRRLVCPLLKARAARPRRSRHRRPGAARRPARRLCGAPAPRTMGQGARRRRGARL